MAAEKTNSNETSPADDSNPKTTDTDAKTPASSPAKHAKRNVHHKGGHKAVVWLSLIVVVLLGVIGGAGWYGYQYYLQTSQALNEIKTSNSSVRESNQALEQQLTGKFQDVSQQMLSLVSKQQQLSDSVETMRTKNQYLRKDWLFMEAEYLIKLANHRLLFERDVNTAIVALGSADQRLRESGDPGVVPVRQVIAEAVQQLKQVPQADLAGISLQLSAINKEIQALPLPALDPKSKALQKIEEQKKSGRKVDSLSELPTAVWKDLRSLVVIRDHEKPLPPMLAPEERFFLIENVRLQIEQARLAMLSGQTQVYKERLQTAIGWITEHFDNKAQITQTTLASLKKLSEESIAPALPDIAFTYQALKKYRLNQQAPPLLKPKAAVNEQDKQEK